MKQEHGQNSLTQGFNIDGPDAVKKSNARRRSCIVASSFAQWLCKVKPWHSLTGGQFSRYLSDQRTRCKPTSIVVVREKNGGRDRGR